jgi:ABC-2 type transport system permease protein
MRNAITIALNDLRIFFSSRGNLVGLVVIPGALTLAIGFFYPVGDGEGGGRLRIDVVDQDNGELSSRFTDTLRQVNQRLALCPTDNDAEDFCQLGDDIAPEATFDAAWATGRVEEGTTLAAIVIPPDFSARVEAGESLDVDYISDEDLTAPGYIRQAVQTAIQRVNGAVVAARVGAQVAEGLQVVPASETEKDAFAQAVYERAAALWGEDLARVDFEQTSEDNEANNANITGFAQSVPGMGTMYVMFMVFGGMASLVGERKQWTLQRIISMPVSRSQLLGGKILSRFTLGMVQYLVVFGIGALAGVQYNDLLALLAVMAAFTLCATALSFAVGTRVDDEAQANSLSNLLVLTLAPLGGAWWPLIIVPAVLRVVGHVSPVAWAMDGFHALLFENGTFADVTVPVFVLAVLAIAFFIVGIWRFRYD